MNASHLFFGHTCEPGACFRLSSDDGRELSATILSLGEVGEDADLWETGRNRERLRELDEDDEIVPAFGLRIALGAEEEAVALPMAADGTILHDFRRRPSVRNGTFPSPVRFLGLESFASKHMGDAWDRVLADGLEDEIAEDMRLLVPEIDSIHFLTGRPGPGGILVGLRDGGRRVPIDNYGDGLRRLLALRLGPGLGDGRIPADRQDRRRPALDRHGGCMAAPRRGSGQMQRADIRNDAQP